MNNAQRLEAAREVRDFKDRHGRDPSQESKDLTEKRLGDRLSKYRQAAQGRGTARLTPEMREVLGDILQVRRGRPQDARKVRDFKDQHGRDPSQASSCLVERKLAHRLGRYRATMKGKRSGALTPEIRAILGDMLDVVPRGVRIPKQVIRDDGKAFASLTSAAQSLGVTVGAVSNALHGHVKTVRGHTFRYATPEEVEQAKAEGRYVE